MRQNLFLQHVPSGGHVTTPGVAAVTLLSDKSGTGGMTTRLSLLKAFDARLFRCCASVSRRSLHFGKIPSEWEVIVRFLSVDMVGLCRIEPPAVVADVTENAFIQIFQ